MDVLKIVEIAIPCLVSISAIYISYKTSSKADKIALKANEIASKNTDLVAQNTALAAENTRLSNGNMEIHLREMISQARRFLASAIQNTIMSKINQNIANDKELQDVVENLLRDAQQDYLNAYEEACTKYIDGKIDKKRFRKTYFEEIRNIVRDKNYKEQFDFSSTYYAIKQVYDEWSNPERS